MDLKNTLAAVSLSAAIIVLWGLFFAPNPEQVKEAQLEKESPLLQSYSLLLLLIPFSRLRQLIF